MVIVHDTICTPNIELLSIPLRPVYLPREFPLLFFTLVYIHPHANAARAAELISNHINKLDSISPDAPKFVLGDFNHCLLDKPLKTFHQYVTCPTRLNNTIDLCYGSVPAAYMSIALPPIGSADHNWALLAPVYKPVFYRHERVVKTVKSWTADSIVVLQDCFDCTEWHVFYDTCKNLNELVDVISSYISFCVDSVIPTKQITVFPNNKTWVAKDLKAVLNKKKRVFFQGTTEEKKQVNKEVKAAIRQAKQQYKQKVELKFVGGNFRDTCQGI